MLKTYIGNLYYSLLTKLQSCNNKSDKSNFDIELYLQNIDNIKYKKFILEAWSKNYSSMEKEFLKNDIEFLKNEVIKKTMFLSTGGKWQSIQISYLKSIVDKEKLKELLQEDCVGHPTITSYKYKTSHNLIHHLYHLFKFQSETDISLDTVNTVVEFGGGYGSMCRLMKRINLNSTYVIIDLPIFSFIQLYYLKEIYGEREVNIILSDKDNIISNKINLIPIDERLVDKIKTIKPDLFMATWSLSEANKYAQDYIYTSNFFDAKSILVAYQKTSEQFQHAESIKVPDKYKIVYNEETEYIPNNYYLFAKY